MNTDTAARPLRLLVAETWDPDGAMVGWLSMGLDPAQFQVLTLPTQEMLPLFGADGVAAAFRAVAHDFRPDVVLVHPPYDFLDVETIRALKAGGAAVVGFAFDEPLFAAARQHPTIAPRFAAAAGAFDVYAVTGRADVESLAAMGVSARQLRFATSAAPFLVRAAPPPWLRPPPQPTPLAHMAVLVGRPYPKRVSLLQALGATDLPLAVFGHGWGELADHLAPTIAIGPPLSRGAMNTVLATAGAVITTGDWEDVQLPMVKYRLLEAAMLGAPQAVQASVDLGEYFDVHELSTWTDADTCITTLRDLIADPEGARARAARVRDVTSSRHLAHHRVAELALAPTAPDACDPIPPAWEMVAAVIAHDAERRGHTALAFEAHLRRFHATGAPDALAGLERLSLQQHMDGVVVATPATPPDALRPSLSTATGLAVQMGGAPQPGLGHTGSLDPFGERLAFRFALDPEAFADPAALAALDDDTRVTLASLLVPPEAPPTSPAARAAWRQLWKTALDAQPRLRADVAAHHAPRWRSYLAGG
jgi:hypothetical protein